MNTTPDFQDYSILIIDDTPTNLGVIVNYLEDVGFEIMAARNGKSGLQIAQRAQPDLILLDIMMPGIDGFETCRRLKADEQTQDIPVIFMTALTNVEDKVKGFAVGGVDYITKPIQQAELLARVQTHLTLSKLQHELEQQVERRTAELVQANTQLKTEMAHREKVEEQLRQSQKMEAIGQLTGGIAHDFNNILTVIMGNISFILNDLDQNGPFIGELEQVQEAAERAASLTRQLLAFSRKQMLQPKVVNLNDTVNNINQMLRRTTREDIAFETYFDPELKPVKVDPGQIEQVIINLVINACDAMPSGGALTIETSNITLDEDYSYHRPEVEAGDYVMLTVSDTGIGMNAETQARIFDPFFTTKERGKGTGLGLATVHGIINQSGGHIWVYSEPGKGTTFKIYFPQLKSVDKTDLPPKPVITTTYRQATIFVVEDEGPIRDLISRVLKAAGHTVITAKNGVEVREKNAKHHGDVDLLITDVIIPGGESGPQIARYLTTCYSSLKVLYISGYTDNTIVHHGVLEPGVNFLSKPFTPAALLDKVHKVLAIEGEDESGNH